MDRVAEKRPCHSMRAHRRKLFVTAVILFAVFICAVSWLLSTPKEPTHDGKSLSVWLDELSSLDYLKSADQGTPQVKALRAIGTNAIPWLLNDFRRGDTWRWRLNQLLGKQQVLKFRFADPNERMRRATRGFWALGELAEPAIPKLLKILKDAPGYVPSALAGIGPPAVPALQQCLTNSWLYTNSLGVYAIVPGNTISDIFNATSFGPFSKVDIAIFLPTIRAWAQQTTNRQAQDKAAWFLNHYDQLPK